MLTFIMQLLGYSYRRQAGTLSILYLEFIYILHFTLTKSKITRNDLFSKRPNFHRICMHVLTVNCPFACISRFQDTRCSKCTNFLCHGKFFIISLIDNLISLIKYVAIIAISWSKILSGSQVT